MHFILHNNNNNIVFDFLGGHHEQLRNDLRSITNTDKELGYLIERCQKLILSQNVNIVKKLTITISMSPGYNIKLQQVVQFRCGIMRLLFVTSTSGSPLGKLLYLLAYPKTFQVLGWRPVGLNLPYG